MVSVTELDGGVDFFGCCRPVRGITSVKIFVSLFIFEHILVLCRLTIQDVYER